MTPPVPDRFELPPEVSFRKERLGGAWAYVFRHNRLGDLGRILLQGRPDGRSQLTLELAGDPHDPMTEERAAIFKPLGLEIAAAFEGATGSTGYPVSPSTELPPQPAPRRRGIVSRHVECERCGAVVALLIFDDTPRQNKADTDLASLEDHARLMYPQIARLDVPTWVIGPPTEDGQLDEALADLLKVWPEREPVRRMTPAAFDDVLDALVSAHC